MGEQEGRLVVVAGPMFAGKSTGLLELTRRRDVLLFKPSMDDRYSREHIETHDGRKKECVVVPAEDGRERFFDAVREEDPEVVGVDEAQFFGGWLVDAVNTLRAERDVFVAGLDRDFRGEFFGVMRELMRSADEVERVFGECEECGEEATRSQRLIDGEPAPYDAPTIEVGGSERYEPRCQECLEVPRE